MIMDDILVEISSFQIEDGAKETCSEEGSRMGGLQYCLTDRRREYKRSAVGRGQVRLRGVLYTVISNRIFPSRYVLLY